MRERRTDEIGGGDRSRASDALRSVCLGGHGIELTGVNAPRGERRHVTGTAPGPLEGPPGATRSDPHEERTAMANPSDRHPTDPAYAGAKAGTVDSAGYAFAPGGGFFE